MWIGWQAVGIAPGDMAPVENTESLSTVDHARYQDWATLGLNAIAAGEVCVQQSYFTTNTQRVFAAPVALLKDARY